ncbi:MAG: hypothetical protein HYW48_10310 [Deltaproteobacteria bacterium]|nr:hypothetical protein [Deltaproteobacteria bacterium]
MKTKPIICLLDEDAEVKQGWELALGPDAQLCYFPDHLELFNTAASQKDLISSFSCIIVGRYFKHINLDTVSSNVTEMLKEHGAGPIFLNWQGYVTKEEVNSKFDGKLFHRYGVKWQTLRLRIQKFEKTLKPAIVPELKRENFPVTFSKPASSISRPDRCLHILKTMAHNAQGPHKEKIEFYAKKDPKTGVKLLEAIYDRLLTDRERPEDCPSRYINTSPIIAKRILQNALYG